MDSSDRAYRERLLETVREAVLEALWADAALDLDLEGRRHRVRRGAGR